MNAEDAIIERMTRHLKDFVPEKGCDVCDHEIIRHMNHSHCSSLGYELICDCPACKGTGEKVDKS